MYFLIDFENVGDEGIRGAQYLLSEDKVIIFYSQACEKIKQENFRQITESLCHLDICKLKKAGKNALDFYISTKVGAIFGSGCAEKAAIVSKDNGFSAVRDYWKAQKEPREVVLGSTLEQCILSANENRSRTAQVREMTKPVRLDTEFALYQERMNARKVLETNFSDPVCHRQTGVRSNLSAKNPDEKIIYLNSVKTFGKKDKRAIYHKMR